MSKRSNRSSKSDLDTTSELDELLSAPSVRPNLDFLGLGEDSAPQVPLDVVSNIGFTPGPSIGVSFDNFDIPQPAPVVAEQPKAEQPIVVDPIPVSNHKSVPSTPRPKKRIEEKPVFSETLVSEPLPEQVVEAVNDEEVPEPVVVQEAEAAIEERTTESDAPVESTRPVELPVPAVPTSPHAEEETKPSSPEVVPDFQLESQSAQSRRKIIHKCVRAQDGHSHVEQEVYATLWRYGREVSTDPDQRLSTIGHSVIAREARIHERSVTFIINRLIQKLSIEIAQNEVSDKRIARTYRIFSYTELLKRRKAAGLEWVIRGRGVEFVDPDSGTPLFAVPKRPRANKAITAPDGILPSDGVMPSDPMHITPSGTDGVTPWASNGVTASVSPGVTPSLIGISRKYSRNEYKASTEQATSSIFPGFDEVRQTLAQFAYADETAVTQLVSECLQLVPDLTAEEICEFVEQKGAIVRASTSIQNPIGFLLATVPKCFAGNAFLKFRERRKREVNESLKIVESQMAQLELSASHAVSLIAEDDSPEVLKQRIIRDFKADPYRPLATYLSAAERTEADRCWKDVLVEIEHMVDRHTFATWFKPLKGFKYYRGTLKVVVPLSEFMHLQQKYKDQIEEAVNQVAEKSPEWRALCEVRLFDGTDFRI